MPRPGGRTQRCWQTGLIVKGIAMMTKERSKVLPNVPTGIEQGTPAMTHNRPLVAL